MMTDSDELRPELRQFLHDRAGAFDRDAAPIAADEATQRTVAHSVEPSRWRGAPQRGMSSGRRPAVAAAVIAALLIGSVGGFAVGHRSKPSSKTVAAAHGAAADSSTPSTIVQSAGTNGAVFAGKVAVACAPSATACPGGPATTRLFIRTTSDGVVLRGYLMTFDLTATDMVPNGKCDPSSWCPPPECMSPNSFNAEVSNDQAVGQSGSGLLPLEGPAASRGQVYIGQAEGAPASVWMVQANDDVTNVRATWPDGYVDEMAPVQGWALVGRNGNGLPNTIEAVLRDGSTTALSNFQNSSYPSECSPPPPPPPELPPAGAEQPDDVESATQGVTAAYQYVFTHGNDPTANGDYLEDADGLKSAGAQVKSNFPEATDTITVTVGEIRFLSKTEAALYFELNYQGGALFGKQVGYAKFIDGTWKIARDTRCMVLGWGGGQCDPPADPARSTTGASSAN
jgi:hypothetical protein